jgi:hypothetical protein
LNPTKQPNTRKVLQPVGSMCFQKFPRPLKRLILANYLRPSDCSSDETKSEKKN